MIGWAARRPAVAWALAVGLLGAGGVAFSRLPLATRTTVELPQLTISASWRGSSPELMEKWVTAPVEGMVQGIRGVRGISSTSNAGSASITVRLDPDVDLPLTRLAILERMELLRSELPPEAQQSLNLSNYVPDELREQPLMTLQVIGSITPGALSQVARDQVIPILGALPGVGSVRLSGGADNDIALTFDPEHLQQYGVDPATLSAAIAGARMLVPLGRIQSGVRDLPITLRDQIDSIAEIRTLPIIGNFGQYFRMDELAQVRPEEDDRGSYFRLNGSTAVVVSLTRLPNADAIRTAKVIRSTLTQLQSQLPHSVQIRVVSDQSEDLSRQLDSLFHRGLIVFAAVFLVLLLGTGKLRGGLIILGSALVAIAGTALGLYLLEIPANLLTLAGLAMGIGVLVQNGLVVVERLEGVADEADARAAAGRQIAPAVLGSTMTTIVVLIPFLYLQGNARAAFMPFAAAFALALFWSIGTALVLIPAVSLASGRTGKWRRLGRINAWTLRLLLRWRGVTVTFSLALVVLFTWGFLKKVPRTNWSNWDLGVRRQVISASVSFPDGYDPAEAKRVVEDLERIALRQRGYTTVTTSGHPEGGSISITFTPEASLGVEPWIASDALIEYAALVGGTSSIGVSRPEGAGFYGGAGGSYGGSGRILIQGYSFEGVRRYAEDLKERLITNPRIPADEVSIEGASINNFTRPTAIVALDPDRSALGRVGATTTDFNQSVAREMVTYGGSVNLMLEGQKMPIVLRSTAASTRELRELGDGLVSNPDRVPIRISDVSRIREISEPGRIERENQRYVRFVSYGFRGPPKLLERTHKAFMASIEVPPGYTVSDPEYLYQSDDSAKRLNLVFGAGVILVLLTVAMIFDSIWVTVMVFLSLPLALSGVVAAFWVTNTGFTREAAVGVILVVGLSVNQAILLIDGVRGFRERQRRVTAAAVYRSALDRTRMIVLVTLTTLASLIPMAWGTKTTDLFGAIALAMAGGTVAGTLGALYLLPAFLPGWRGLLRRPRWLRRKQLSPPALSPEP